jgi:hypothetical protein
MYFFLCQDTFSLNWRFLTSPPDGGFVRNDNINWYCYGEAVAIHGSESQLLP